VLILLKLLIFLPTKTDQKVKFSTPKAKRKHAESPWLLVEFPKWDYFRQTLHRGSNGLGTGSASTRQSWEWLQSYCRS